MPRSYTQNNKQPADDVERRLVVTSVVVVIGGVVDCVDVITEIHTDKQ